MELELTPLKLPLKVVWKISRNSSSEKLNFIVTLKDNGFVAESEVAPNVRYGETSEIIQAEFLEFKNLLSAGYLQALDLRPWKHSLRFALESAYLSLQAQKQGRSL